MLINLQTQTLLRLRPARARKSGFGTFLDLARAWSERRRSRRDLSRLDARLLRDIGLAPGEAMRESQMPFWKI